MDADPTVPGGIDAAELTAQRSTVGQHIPQELARASSRLKFPPSYVVVGVYRLVTDKSLYKPFWDKCKHGLVRGAAVGAAWAFFTFNVQRKLVHLFWMNSPTVVDLSDDTLFGYKIPFDLNTYATIVFLSSQVSIILSFFLIRNLRVARQRAWDQTVASRGKGPDFWQPYVEEWDDPPVVDEKKWAGIAVAQGWMMSYLVKRIVLIPVRAIPVAGLFVSAWFKSLDTARYLHRPYFETKKMTRREIAVFIVEHKYHYRAFGFAAALLESIPFLGLIFSVSNRIGAAMWAHDLEKRQHFIAEEKRKKAT